MKTEFKFNPIKLIDEVRKRPGLYSTAQPVDREEKLDMWRQVGAALYEDWGDYNKAACYDRILTLQRKWRSLRDAYNREIRLRQAAGAGPRRNRRVYIYFKRLAFLGKYDGDIQSEDDPEGEDGAADADPISEPEQRPKVRKTKKKKRRRRSNSSDDQRQDEDASEAPGGSGDSDKLFLLSFLPEMRRLPPNIKMWARTRIANVMQEAVTFHYENLPLPDVQDIKRISPSE